MKKAVFITYNQALTERVAFLLDQLQIKGFTQWPLVNGAGTETGEPRMGSHTWPEMNSGYYRYVLIRKLNRVCAKQLHRPYSKILFLNHNRQSA